MVHTSVRRVKCAVAFYLIESRWHIYASIRYTIIASDNDLSPGGLQAIIWTNAGILLTGPLGTNFSENSIEMHTFSFKKMHLKMSSGKWQPFCLGINVLSSDLICVLLLLDKKALPSIKTIIFWAWWIDKGRRCAAWSIFQSPYSH